MSANVHPEPTFDKHGYPTDDTLQLIEKWDRQDFHGVMQFIQKASYYDDCFKISYDPDNDITTYVFYCHGGNKNLMDALRDNIILYNRHWESIHRGGCYVFSAKGKPLSE